jgi:hypothetical protein
VGLRTEAALDLAGSYAVDVVSGTMAAGLAAASPVFSCRWGDATGKLMVLRQLALEMNSLGTGFTAGLGLFEVVKATGFTVADTGGTAVTPAAGKAKRRTTNADSAITDLRQASTATLTAGTRTLDAQPFASIRAQIDVTANKVFVPALGGNPHALLFEAYQVKDLPLVLAQDEGFIIRATVPATGTWEFRVLMEWQEVNSY